MLFFEHFILGTGKTWRGVRYTVGCGSTRRVQVFGFYSRLKAALKGRCARSKAEGPTQRTLLCSMGLLDPLSPNLKSIFPCASKQKIFFFGFFSARAHLFSRVRVGSCVRATELGLVSKEPQLSADYGKIIEKKKKCKGRRPARKILQKGAKKWVRANSIFS